MTLSRRAFTTSAIALSIAPATAARAAQPDTSWLGAPLRQAHAHNDYEHPRPLLDALAHGFTSVEADVWLVDGQLRVAHDAWEVAQAPTLEEAYLEPLARLASPNGKRIFPGYDRPLQLLIDLKSQGEETWLAVEDALAEHSGLFTRVHRGKVRERAVQAVISGDRPLELMRSATTRFSFYDGRSTDLDSGLDPAFMPLVSENWTKLFSWQGVGPMPADQRQRLRDHVARAHAQGYRVRFWATHDQDDQARRNLWTELVAAGVDHLNTDDLAGLQTFLSA